MAAVAAVAAAAEAAAAEAAADVAAAVLRPRRRRPEAVRTLVLRTCESHHQSQGELLRPKAGGQNCCTAFETPPRRMPFLLHWESDPPKTPTKRRSLPCVKHGVKLMRDFWHCTKGMRTRCRRRARRTKVKPVYAQFASAARASCEYREFVLRGGSVGVGRVVVSAL